MSHSKFTIGVDYPCFGEFKCPHCPRTWESTVAWRDYGQQCKSCTIFVKASSLQRFYYYYCEPCLTTTKGQIGKWKYKFCEEGNPCRSCKRICQPFDRVQYQVGKYVLPKLGESPIHTDPNIEHQRELCERCKMFGGYCKFSYGNTAPEARGGMEMWQLRVRPVEETVPPEISEMAPEREEEMQAVPPEPEVESVSPAEGAASALNYDEDFPAISSSTSLSSSQTSLSNSGIRTRFPKPKRNRKPLKQTRQEPEALEPDPTFETPATSSPSVIENRVENAIQDEPTLSSTHPEIDSPRVRPPTPFPAFPSRSRQSFMCPKPGSQILTKYKLVTDNAQALKKAETKMMPIAPATKQKLSTSNANPTTYYCRPDKRHEEPEPNSIGKMMLFALLIFGLSYGLSTIFKGRGK